MPTLTAYFAHAGPDYLMGVASGRPFRWGRLTIFDLQPVTLPMPSIWEVPDPDALSVTSMATTTPTEGPTMRTRVFELTKFNYMGRPVYALRTPAFAQHKLHLWDQAEIETVGPVFFDTVRGMASEDDDAFETGPSERALADMINNPALFGDPPSHA